MSRCLFLRYLAECVVAVYLVNPGGHVQFDLSTLMPVDGNQYQTSCKVFTASRNRTSYLTEYLAWAAQILSVPATGLTKLSVLFFYKRIFVGKNFKAVVWGSIALVVAWIIAFILANLGTLAFTTTQYAAC